MVGKVVQRGNTIYLSFGEHTFQYEERARIGSGAMGVVYAGHNCQTGEPVAIKRVVDRYANNPEIRYRAHRQMNFFGICRNLFPIEIAVITAEFKYHVLAVKIPYEIKISLENLLAFRNSASELRLIFYGNTEVLFTDFLKRCVRNPVVFILVNDTF